MSNKRTVEKTSRDEHDSCRQPSQAMANSAGPHRMSSNLDAELLGPRVRVELAINFNDERDLLSIDRALSAKGARMTSADVAEKVVQIELKLADGSQHHEVNKACYDVESIQNHIERQTGFVTVVKGLGDTASAVAEMRPSYSKLADDVEAITAFNESHRSTYGVIRLTQLEGKQCFVDGSVGGLEDGESYSLAIHSYGDLSGDAYENVGPIHTHLTNLDANKGNKFSISRIITDCDIPSVIGRSAAVQSLGPSDASGKIVSAGVIARASTIQANQKKVCACSGKTIWEERLDKRT